MTTEGLANPRGSGFSRTPFAIRLAVLYGAPVLVVAFAIGVALGRSFGL